MDLIFGLNSAYGRGWNNSYTPWDASNTKELLDFVEQRGYQVDFELGNEPRPEKFGWNITGVRHTNNLGTELGEAFVAFAALLQGTGSVVYGPDVDEGSTADFITGFLTNAGHTLAAFTWHYYVAEDATSQQLLTRSAFSTALQLSQDYQDLISSSPSPGKQTHSYI